MEFYELMFLLDVNLPEEDRLDVTDEIEEEVIDVGGEVESTSQYDVRDLAYPIDNITRADYRLIEFQIEEPGQPLEELRERLNFHDDIIRYLITNRRKDRHPDAVFESQQEEEDRATEEGEEPEESRTEVQESTS